MWYWIENGLMQSSDISNQYNVCVIITCVQKSGISGMAKWLHSMKYWGTYILSHTKDPEGSQILSRACTMRLFKGPKYIHSALN